MSVASRFFQINCLALENDEYCQIGSNDVAGMERGTWKPCTGVEVDVAAEYPAGARFYMWDRHPGVEVPSLVGNYISYLVVERRMKESIERLNEARTQYLPVSIYNHKKRLAAADYFIVNPLGTFDCLDLERSEIERLEGTEKVVAVRKLVLSAEKVKAAPALFRPREDPRRYIARGDLVKAWIQMDPTPTNVLLDELEVAR